MDAGQIFLSIQSLQIRGATRATFLERADAGGKLYGSCVEKKKNNSLIGALGSSKWTFLIPSQEQRLTLSLTTHGFNLLNLFFLPKITRIYNSCSAASDGVSMLYIGVCVCVRMRGCVFGLNISEFRRDANELWGFLKSERKKWLFGTFLEMRNNFRPSLFPSRRRRRLLFPSSAVLQHSEE